MGEEDTGEAPLAEGTFSASTLNPADYPRVVVEGRSALEVKDEYGDDPSLVLTGTVQVIAGRCLKLAVPSGARNIVWEIGPDAITSYRVEDDGGAGNGVYAGLTDAQKTERRVKFCFWKLASERVSVAADLGGSRQELTIVFDVRGPEVTSFGVEVVRTASVVLPDFFPGEPARGIDRWLALYRPGGRRPGCAGAVAGCAMSATIRADAAHEGMAGFIQLIKVNRKKWMRGDDLATDPPSTQIMSTGTHYSLDNAHGVFYNASGGAPAFLNAGETTLSGDDFTDIPCLPVESNNTKVEAHDDFQLYVMFRPSRGHSSDNLWAPLKFITWRWSGTATRAAREGEEPSRATGDPGGTVTGSGDSAAQIPSHLPRWQAGRWIGDVMR